MAQGEKIIIGFLIFGVPAIFSFDRSKGSEGQTGRGGQKEGKGQNFGSPVCTRAEEIRQ